LKCGYCFAHGGEYEGVNEQPVYMSYDCYKQSISYFENRYSGGIGTISFFGGEPLLDFENIKKFLEEYFFELEAAGKAIPDVDISTNATLLTEEMVLFFRKYNIAVALSLDGPKAINDQVRRFRNDKSSVYDSVEKSIQLLERHQVEYHIQMVLHKSHLENYRHGMAVSWLKELEKTKCKSVAISPVVSHDAEYALEKLELLESLSDFAREITCYYLEQMQKPEPKILSPEMIAPVLPIVKQSYSRDCNAGYNVTIDTDGSIYPCQMFCGKQEFLLGNVFEERFYQSKADKILDTVRADCESCKSCIAKSVCTVWCKGIHHMLNETMYQPVLDRCVFQRAILDECIKKMAEIQKGTEEYRMFCKNIFELFGGKKQNGYRGASN
jgi:radical SAM protein with 4Fe4S-binding SPASM domain